MPQTARLWTIAGLATELGRNVRTIASALRNTPPDGKCGRHPGWRMSTAVARLSLPADRRRSNGGNEELYSDIERLAGDLQRNLEKLAAEPSVAARRQMVEGGIFHAVGKLDGMLADTVKMRVPSINLISTG
jgi:hypothetical protein